MQADAMRRATWLSRPFDWQLLTLKGRFSLSVSSPIHGVFIKSLLFHFPFPPSSFFHFFVYRLISISGTQLRIVHLVRWANVANIPPLSKERKKSHPSKVLLKLTQLCQMSIVSTRIDRWKGVSFSRILYLIVSSVYGDFISSSFCWSLLYKYHSCVPLHIFVNFHMPFLLR